MNLQKLLELEPRIRPLLAEAYSYQTSDTFCAATVLMGGIKNRKSLNERLGALVGWSRKPHKLLGTSEAYDLAFHAIQDALPPCGLHCYCQTVVRVFAGVPNPPYPKPDKGKTDK